MAFSAIQDRPRNQSDIHCQNGRTPPSEISGNTEATVRSKMARKIRVDGPAKLRDAACLAKAGIGFQDDAPYRKRM
jgi:hypothetical protein